MAIAEVILRVQDQGSAPARAVAAGLREVVPASDAAAASSEGFRKRADDLGDTASKLAQGLGVLSPELQGLAMLFADVADGAVGLADAAGLSGASMASLGIVAGALALAVGAVAAVAVDVSREMEIAAEVSATYRQATDDLRASTRALEDAELDHAAALGLVTAAQRDEMAARLDAQRSIQDYGAGLRDQRAELREGIAENQKFTDVLDSLEGTIFVGAYAMGSLADSVLGWSESIEGAEKQLQILDQAEQKAAENAKAALDLSIEGIIAKDEEAQAEERLRDAKTRKAEAERQASEWTREAMEVNRAYYAMLDSNTKAMLAGYAAFYAQESPTAKMNARLEPLISDVDELVPREALSRLEELQLLLLQLNAEASKSPESMAALADSIGRVQGAINAASTGTAGQGPQATQTGIPTGIGGATQALGAIAGGAGSALSAAGPYGALAAGIVAAVDAIVVRSDESGEVGLVDQARAFADELLQDLAVLPQALISQLAETDFGALSAQLADTVESLFVGIVEMLPDLIIFIIEANIFRFTALSNAIIGAIPDILAALIEVFGDPQTWIDMAAAIVEAVKETVKTGISGQREFISDMRALDTSSGVFSSARTGVKVVVDGFMGDGRDVATKIRDVIGSLGNGIGLDRDGRFA